MRILKMGALCSVLVAGLAVAALQPQNGAPIRRVSIAISVVDDADSPIANVPLVARVGGQTITDTTNAQGQVSVSAWRVPEGELRGRVVMSSLREVLKPTDDHPEIVRAKELRCTHSFPYLTSFVVDANGVSQQVVIRAPKAIQLTTRFLKPNGEAVAGLCWVVGKMAFEETGADGTLVLKGLPRAEVSQVAVRVKGQQVVQVFDVDPGQAETAFTLADQTIAIPERTIPIAAQIGGLQVFAGDSMASGTVVTLVSASGDQWFEYGLEEDGTLIGQADGSTKIAPGTYFAVPGSGLLGRYAAEVRRLVKAGKSADELEAAGIVRLVVPANAEAASVVMDAAVVRAAIASFGGIEW